MAEPATDDVAADIGAAWDAVEAPAAIDVVETPVAEPGKPAEEADRPRGPDGKFIAKDASAEPVAPKEAATEKPESPLLPKQDGTPSIPAASSLAAPASPPPGWSVAAKQEFAKLPPAVQEAVAKRETEVNQGFAKLQDFKGLEPVVEMAKRSGITPAQIFENYRHAEHMLATDGLNAIKELARSFDIDLTKLGAPPADGQQQQPAITPELTELRKELNALKTTLVTRDQSTAQAEITAFTADPKHTYFENVRQDMAHLINSGQAKDLQDAYDKACWLHPEIRAALIKEEQTRTQAEAKRLADEAASKARLASKSITGAPNGNGAEHAPDRSLRDEIAAQFE